MLQVCKHVVSGGSGAVVWRATLLLTFFLLTLRHVTWALCLCVSLYICCHAVLWPLALALLNESRPRSSSVWPHWQCIGVWCCSRTSHFNSRLNLLQVFFVLIFFSSCPPFWLSGRLGGGLVWSPYKESISVPSCLHSSLLGCPSVCSCHFNRSKYLDTSTAP